MKIDIKTIRDSKTVELKGDEDWLKDFYKAFPSKNTYKLTGSLTLRPDDYEHCEVSGTVNYKAIIACTHCTAPIEHEVKAAIKMLYRPSKYDLNANEVELSSGELEANYMSENDEIELCQLLIDFMNDQIPDFVRCQKCVEDKDKGPIYKSENDEKLNPFAKLKDLKFPN